MFAFLKFEKINEEGFSATLIRQIGIDALVNIVTKKFILFNSTFVLQLAYFIYFFSNPRPLPQCLFEPP